MHNLISDKEKLRKTIHLLFGTGILLMINLLGIIVSQLIIATLLFFGVLLSLLIKHGLRIPFIQRIIEQAERENERPFPGRAAVYFFTSTLILLLVFPKYPQLVIAAISVQVFADTAAAIIGTKYGAHNLLGKKTWEGSLAFFITAVTCLSFFYELPIAIAAGLTATIIEAIPLDDNLLVPLVTGITLKLLT